MAIRVICKNCHSKIDANEKLLGQTRKCPKCQHSIIIVPESNSVSSQKDIPIRAEVIPETKMTQESGLVPGKFPSTLTTQNKYCICSPERLVAYWELGKGWFYNAGTGFVPATRNRDIIPEQGVFTLVEIVVETVEDVKRPNKVNVFELQSHWSLLEIACGDDAILGKIIRESKLSKVQKVAVLDYLRTNYMPNFLYESKELIHYFTEE